MSLATNVTDLATRVATEAKALRTLLNGNAVDNSALTTTAKANLVAAINEVAAAVSGASGIDDNTTGTTTSWSSSKTASEIDSNVSAAVAALVGDAPATLDTINELAAALSDNPDAVSAIETALGLRVSVDAVQSFTGPQQTQGRSNIAAASAADLTTLTTNVGSTSTNFVTTFENGLV